MKLACITYDPLCGWCYAAAPLVQAAREIMPVLAHGGGMLTGTRRKQISTVWRDYVRQNDQQIAKVTGQIFCRAYLDGLLEDHSAWLDSEPPIAAVLAAEQMEARGLDMLSRLYVAHYVEGMRVADTSTLIHLAVEMGLHEQVFQETLEAKHSQQLDTSRNLKRCFIKLVDAAFRPSSSRMRMV